MKPTQTLTIVVVCLTIFTFGVSSKSIRDKTLRQEKKRISPQCAALARARVSLEYYRQVCGDFWLGKSAKSLPLSDEDEEIEEIERVVSQQGKRDVAYTSERDLLSRLAKLLAKHYKGETRREVTWSTYQDVPSVEVVKDAAPEHFYDGSESPMYLIRKWYETIPPRD